MHHFEAGPQARLAFSTFKVLLGGIIRVERMRAPTSDVTQQPEVPQQVATTSQPEPEQPLTGSGKRKKSRKCKRKKSRKCKRKKSRKSRKM